MQKSPPSTPPGRFVSPRSPGRIRPSQLAFALALAGAGCSGDSASDSTVQGGPASEAARTAEEVPAERLVHAIAESASSLPRGPVHEAETLRGRFDDEAAARGLDYLNRSGEPHKPTILGANGAGVAVLDLGGDGDLDLAFGQGLERLSALLAGPGADLELFANDGAGRFTRLPGPGLSGWWTGLAAGDVDGDGDTDLVAAAYGDLALLLQDTSGSLAAVAETGDLRPPLEGPGGPRLVPGAEREPGSWPWWATSVALYDGDRDGQLDLFVGQYLELDPLRPPLGALGEGDLELPCTWKGLEVFCGPRGMRPQPDRVLRGRGDGRFEDRSADWLPGHVAGYTLAVGALDAEGDGDTDLYVANDSMANLLLVNDGTGRLGDVGLQAGVALNQDGAAQAGMGVAFGDIDRDGLQDLAVTNFSGEPTEVYFGFEVGFRARTHAMGLGQATRRMLSWGVHLVDFDGDGWLELFTANGHVYPQADEEYTGTRYAQADGLWRLVGDGPVEPLALAGERALTALVLGSRGSALGDFDGDLAPDLVVTTVDGPAVLAMNRLEPRREDGGHRLALLLLGPQASADEPAGTGEGPRTPADGRGARVVVVPAVPEGEPRYAILSEVQTSESYQSSTSPWRHFGLGRATSFERIDIRWPSGRTEQLAAGPADRRLVIREGQGIVREETP